MTLGIPSSPAALFDDLGDGVVLRVEPKALWELGDCSTTELHPGAC